MILLLRPQLLSVWGALEAHQSRGGGDGSGGGVLVRVCGGYLTLAMHRTT